MLPTSEHSGSGAAIAAGLQVVTAASHDAAAWDRFVESRPEACNYHRWGWKRVIEETFRWPAHYLMAVGSEGIVGVLPLIHQHGRLLGSFLISLPFFNYGGVLAATPQAEQALVEHAVGLARSYRVKYLELRHRDSHAQVQLAVNTQKVTLIRPLEETEDLLWKSIDKKVRSDVRKSMSYELTAEVGRGRAAVDEFYPIFAANMRDLGTPVYSRTLFDHILDVFPDDTYITIVRSKGKAIASSFLCGFRDTLEVPWSASRREHLSQKPNMLLYWKNLCVARENGYRKFDFGRSWKESGTHRFKLQWEPEEIPLYWNYWTPTGEAPGVNVKNKKYAAAIAAWKKLPLSLANRIGPRIARCLP